VVSTEEDRIWDQQQDERELGPRPPLGYPEEPDMSEDGRNIIVHRGEYEISTAIDAHEFFVQLYDPNGDYYNEPIATLVLSDVEAQEFITQAIDAIDELRGVKALEHIIARKEENPDHAFHYDGEPCERAVITHNCPFNHRYGRTFEEAR
jgi:hypothetical protein